MQRAFFTGFVLLLSLPICSSPKLANKGCFTLLQPLICYDKSTISRRIFYLERRFRGKHALKV